MSRVKKFGILFFAMNMVPAIAFGGVSPTASTPNLPFLEGSVGNSKLEAPKAVTKKKTPRKAAEKMHVSESTAANVILRKESPDGVDATVPATKNASPAATSTAATTGLPKDLGLKDAKDTFINFSADLMEKDGDQTAKLYGMIYQKCLKDFTFSIPDTTKGVAFQIHDKGDGANCMKDLRATHGDQCQPEGGDDTYKCIKLSSLVSIDLKDKKDGDIGLLSIHTNEDKDADHFEQIGKLHYKSPETIIKEEETRVAQERARQIDLYRSQVSGCVNNENQLEIARGALASLLNMGEIEDSEMTQLTAKLDMAELDVLNKEAEEASIEDLSITREKLHALSMDHPKLNERIATVLFKIENRYRKSAEQNPDAFKDAKETISEAQNLKGLKPASVDHFKEELNGVNYEASSALADDGRSYAFFSSYQSLTQTLYKEYNKECGGKRASMEVCMNTITTLQRASALPQHAYDVDVKKYQQELRIQQEMQKAMNPGTNQQQQSPAIGPQQPAMYAGGTLNNSAGSTIPSGFSQTGTLGNGWAGSSFVF